MSTYDFEPNPDDYRPEPAHIANGTKDKKHIGFYPMSAHTAGRWVAHNTGEHVFTIKATSVHVNASAGEKERSYYQGIASVSERGEHPQHGGGISFKTCQANARLIAAAPELLGCLETLLGHAMHYASMPHAHSEAHRDVANTRAAIAKATSGAT